MQYLIIMSLPQVVRNSTGYLKGLSYLFIHLYFIFLIFSVEGHRLEPIPVCTGKNVIEHMSLEYGRKKTPELHSLAHLEKMQSPDRDAVHCIKLRMTRTTESLCCQRIYVNVQHANGFWWVWGGSVHAPSQVKVTTADKAYTCTEKVIGGKTIKLRLWWGWTKRFNMLRSVQKIVYLSEKQILEKYDYHTL